MNSPATGVMQTCRGREAADRRRVGFSPSGRGSAPRAEAAQALVGAVAAWVWFGLLVTAGPLLASLLHLGALAREGARVLSNPRLRRT